MRILVTGGAGFIGSHFVRESLLGRYPATNGADLVVLDKLTYAGRLANLASVRGHPRFTFVRGDVVDARRVPEIVADVDAVVHFAAESHVDRSIGAAADFVTTNVVGTQVLLDAAIETGLQRFVHVSTDEVYGSITTGSWTESQPMAPSSPYSASKAGSDLLAQAYAHTHGLHVSITRCSNNYGPYQFPEKIIPLFVTNLLEGKRVPLYGDGRHVREWLHVDDHCRGISLVLERGRAGEIYHLGGGTELTNWELTDRLLKTCGAEWSSVDFVPDRKGHDRRYSLDFSKAGREIGYRPCIDFDVGLHDTIRWYQNHRTWWEPVKHESRGDCKVT